MTDTPTPPERTELDVLLDTVATHITWLRDDVGREQAHRVDNYQSAGYLERLVAEVERLQAELDDARRHEGEALWSHQQTLAEVERLRAAAAAFTLDDERLVYEHSDGEACAVKVTCPAAREALGALLADPARPTPGTDPAPTGDVS